MNPISVVQYLQHLGALFCFTCKCYKHCTQLKFSNLNLFFLLAFKLINQLSAKEIRNWKIQIKFELRNQHARHDLLLYIDFSKWSASIF